MELAFLNLGSMELLIMLIIAVIVQLIPFFCLIDLYKREVKSNNQLLLTVGLIWFIPLLGALIYLFLIQPELPKKEMRNWS